MGNKLTFEFKTKYSLQERQNMSIKLLQEKPDFIPIICEPTPNSDLPPFKKTRYLVRKDMTASELIATIREKVILKEGTGLFLFTSKGKSLSGDITMMETYNINKDKEDNFLYVFCGGEVFMG